MMKFNIDQNKKIITVQKADGTEESIPLYSAEGFKLLSKIWMKQEWNQLHWQSFSWMGLPLWQFPEDVLRLQEVILKLKPDVIIETGISRGGSTLFFASMCRLLGKGRVVSVDIRIPGEVRQAIEKSPVSKFITLVEGDSSAPDVVESIHSNFRKNEKVFVFLDSDHSKTHVLKELESYGDLVTPGSYIVATDGIMRDLADTPLGKKEWEQDNPSVAAQAFVATHPEFEIEKPKALFGNQYVIEELTYWPMAWIRRKGKGQ